MRRRRHRRRRCPKGCRLLKRTKRIRKLLGRGVKRPYVDKRNRLMLGSGSRNKSTKQRGGFFSLGTALAAALPIIDLLGKLIK